MSGANDSDPGFLSGLSDAFSSPLVQVLAGIAQGAGQAAMPSRMPISSGSVWGSIAGGIGKGLAQSQSLRQQAQQLQAAQIANQRNKMLMNYFSPSGTQAGGGAPFGVPQGVGGDNGGQSGSGQQTSGQGATSGQGSPNYLMNPAQTKQLADLMAATGQDRAAAALYSMLGSQAGGPGYAFGTNGTAFAVPGGAKDPGTIATNAAAEANAKIPAAVATAGGEALAKAPFQDPITVPVQNPDGSYSNLTIPRLQWAAQQGNGAAVPAPVYANKIAAAESGNNPTATSSTSTAGGAAQFIDPTWVSTFRSTYPDQAQGMTDQQILGLKTNPDVSSRMTVAYAQQNAPKLSQAGVPVNIATLALAHRFGPAGATSIYQAAQTTPQAPIAAVVSPDVMKANPDLQGQTVGRVVGNQTMRFGTAPVDLGQGGVAGGFRGPPILTPQQQAAQDIETARQKGANTAAQDIEKTRQTSQITAAAGEAEERAKGYGADSAGIIKAGSAAPVALQRLDVLSNAASTFRPGMSADMRADAMKAMTDGLQTLGITPPDSWRSGAAASETIDKEGGYLAAEMTRALGSREAASVFNQVRGIQPNKTMSDGGFQVVVNSLRQGLTRDQDLAQFQEKWLAPTAQGGMGNTSIAGMRDAFEKQFPVQAYASRVVPYPVPKTPNSLVPNTIYAGPNGLGLWDGKSFQPVGAQPNG